jgi:acetolactate synthase small subunit
MEKTMQAFHIHYRNTQGTLMRILTAVSRRALDITYVHAQVQPDDQTYRVSLLLEVNPKQIGQLRRDWYAIMDVEDVRLASAESLADHASSWPGALGPRPSSTTSLSANHTEDTARAARA